MRTQELERAQSTAIRSVGRVGNTKLMHSAIWWPCGAIARNWTQRMRFMTEAEGSLEQGSPTFLKLRATLRFPNGLRATSSKHMYKQIEKSKKRTIFTQKTIFITFWQVIVNECIYVSLSKWHLFCANEHVTISFNKKQNSNCFFPIHEIVSTPTLNLI